MVKKRTSAKLRGGNHIAWFTRRRPELLSIKPPYVANQLTNDV